MDGTITLPCVIPLPFAALRELNLTSQEEIDILIVKIEDLHKNRPFLLFLRMTERDLCFRYCLVQKTIDCRPILELSCLKACVVLK